MHAGYQNTGTGNSFFGVNAGNFNTTGGFNSFFGYAAGFNNTTGSPNAFFGDEAGFNNTTGRYNSFFGIFAGNDNTTGSNNTMLGMFSNVATGNLSYATAIGSFATVSTSDTIVLGKLAGTYDSVVRPADTILIPGLLQLNTLGTEGGRSLCRNASNQIAACSSSLRYKTNIRSFTSGLSLVQRLHPIRFEWKAGGLKDVGFGAEDVAAVEPLLVTYNANGEVEGVKYDRISAVLVNAIKEQQTQIKAQQSQLQQQQQQLNEQQTLIIGLKKLLCQQNLNAGICQ